MVQPDMSRALPVSSALIVLCRFLNSRMVGGCLGGVGSGVLVLRLGKRLSMVVLMAGVMGWRGCCWRAFMALLS